MRSKYDTKRVKYRQRRSIKKNKTQSKKGRKTMIGGHSPEFIAYINSMLSNCSEGGQVPPHSTPIGRVLRSIRVSGFTNKMQKNGRFVSQNTPQLTDLRDDTIRFWKWTKQLNERAGKPPLLETFKLYRSSDIDALDAQRNSIQSIPFSCTWDINFAIAWMGGNHCCLFEINMTSDDVFLPVSLPVGQVHPDDTVQQHIDAQYVLFNPKQSEVIVAPCILNYTGSTHHNGLIVYQYNATSMVSTSEITKNFNTVVTNGCFF